MKTTYQIALIGLLLLISCEQHDLDIETGTEKKRLPKFAYTSLDKEEQLANALEGYKRTLSKGAIGARVRNGLEDINPDSIAKVLQSDNASYTYTLRLENGNSLSSFENLVLRRTVHGYIGFVVEYQSKGLFDPANPTNFTGTIRKYNLEGNLLKERYFENGRPIAVKSGRVAGVCYLSGLDLICADPERFQPNYLYGQVVVGCREYAVKVTYDCPEEYTPNGYTGYGTYFADYTPGGGGSIGGTVTNINGVWDPVSETTTFVPDDPWALSPPLPTAEELLELAIQNRETALTNFLAVHPLALMGFPCDELPKWQAISTIPIPQSVMDRLNALESQTGGLKDLLSLNDDWELHQVTDGSGSAVNLDEFGVRVTLPSSISPEFLLEHIRTTFMTQLNFATFSPHPLLPGESAKWYNPSTALGSILSIDMLDDGSVILIQKSSNSFTFTTIEDPYNFEHPVCGNRQFGFEANSDGSYTFYTRGVDRITYLVESVARDVVHFKTKIDALDMGNIPWLSLQELIADYVNSPQIGGTATINTPIKRRPDYDKLSKFLSGELTVDQLEDCN